MLGLVVAGNGDINVVNGAVEVSESDDGDVDVAGLTNGLVVSTGVSDDDETGLLEVLGKLVSEDTGGETTSERSGTSVGSELENSTLTVGTGAHSNNVGRVGHSSNNASGQVDLLPGLVEVDDVDTVGTGSSDVRLVAVLDVLGTDVGLSGQKELSVSLSKIKRHYRYDFPGR